MLPLPTAVIRAIRELNQSGYEAYAVGGCVRDLLMGKIPQDWDITTSAMPEQMQAVFQGVRTIDTGLRHGTLTVLMDGTPLEITTYRIDGTYSDGRHPDRVSFTSSLAEDLCRRDFTVNAMAYHPEGGLIDFFDGQSDVKKGIIRCVGIPSDRFSEDALRILRALRFSATLDFRIEAETAQALIHLSPTLTKVSIERISAEFQKLVCGKNAEDIVNTFGCVIAEFIPEIVVRTEFRLLSRVRPTVCARLAALFYEVGVSASEAVDILHRLRVDNKTVCNVSLLLTSMTKGIWTQDAYILHLLHRLGPDLIFDYLAIREFDSITVNRVTQLLAEGACYSLPQLAVNGNDLIANGIAPGKGIGELLEKLLFAVINGACDNNKMALLEYMQTLKEPVQ